MTNEERIECAYNRVDDIIYSERVSDGLYIPAPTIAGILIQNVGRFCESHAADFLIDWDRITKIIKEKENDPNPSISYVALGIRELGIDGNEFLITRINEAKDPYEFTQNYYRKIFIVAIERKKHEYFNDIMVTDVTLKDVKSVIR